MTIAGELPNNPARAKKLSEIFSYCIGVEALEGTESTSLLSLGVAQLLCPPDVINRAIEIVSATSNYQVCTTTISNVYLIRNLSPRNKLRTVGKYLVVPGKFCSCRYYSENVLISCTGWTCKHDLAVRLITTRPDIFQKSITMETDSTNPERLLKEFGQ